MPGSKNFEDMFKNGITIINPLSPSPAGSILGQKFADKADHVTPPLLQLLRPQQV